MGKNQMVLTFSGENNSIFDARKPYLTQWDLEKCNERDNKNSIKCNYDKNNVLYQERKIPRASTALGRAWGLRWVNIMFSLEKKTLYCFIFTFSWHCTWKGWPEPGRAELRDSRSSAKSGVGASFAKEEAKGYLISAAAAQKVLTDRSKILFWETVAITRSNAQFAAWEIKMIYWKTSLLGSNAALEHDQRCIKISRFRLC